MIDKLKAILDEGMPISEGGTGELANFLLSRGIYISDLKIGQTVFGIIGDGVKRKIFKGRVCGITYTQVDSNPFPEVWYTVALENNAVEILKEDQIFGSMKEALGK